MSRLGCVDPYQQSQEMLRHCNMNAGKSRIPGQVEESPHFVTGSDGYSIIRLGSIFNTSRGEAQHTGKELDVCISTTEGLGWYLVVRDASERELATRDGRMHLNSEGRLCINNYEVMGEGGEVIEVPSDSVKQKIDPDGSVWSFDREGKAKSLGSVCLKKWTNEQGLESVENNCFLPTEKAGESVEARPGNNAPRLISGHVEGSNVDLRVQSQATNDASSLARYDVQLENTEKILKDLPLQILSGV